MVPAGFKIDFSYNARRENYVTICQMDSLRWNPKSHLLELHWRDQVIEIPLVIKAPLGRVEMLRDLFRRTAELTRSAIYADHIAAEMLMQTVVAEFIEYSRSASAEVVPEHIARLKKLIDEDTAFRYDLSEIMSEFKYTSIYLRRLFKKYYSTNPAEYRARLRFNRIQQLLSESDLSIKEVADAVGMNHVTHLHTFVKQRCGMTPGELRRNLDM